MRILSDGLHDYYDSVQSVDQDRSITYIRRRKDIIISDAKFPLPRWVDNGYYRTLFRCPRIKQYIVGFCGKIYPVLEIVWHDAPVKFCFNLEEVDNYIRSRIKQKALPEYLAHGRKRVSVKYWPYALRQSIFRAFFEKCEVKISSFGSFFTEYECPIFLAIHNNYSDWDIQLNGNLAAVEFFRVFDPYRAFQEISMYLSNLAVPIKPIPSIPDKVMVGAKGFDKWSFRRMSKDSK